MKLLKGIGHGLRTVKDFFVVIFVVLGVWLVTKDDPNGNTG
ncbi:MAG TPA: hypothetical protein PKN92_10270 [Candidatus Hydrogenedentes bacterium]|nr:hypothetical protein [Candidatus Hydrogenedentota bacterium]